MAERVWRAITASGIVASTRDGRIRWRTAETKAPSSSESSESINRNPVTGSTQNSAEIRPETGVQCRMPENRMIIISPDQ